MKWTSILVMFLLFSIDSSYAASSTSCQQDVDQMSEQIIRWQRIETKDGNVIDYVSRDTQQQGEKYCSSYASYKQYFSCTLVWERSNWGDTFHCE